MISKFDQKQISKSNLDMGPITAILDFTEEQLCQIEAFGINILYRTLFEIEMIIKLVALHPRSFFLMTSFICLNYYLYQMFFDKDEETPVLLGKLMEISDTLNNICSLVESARKKNVLINVVTLQEVTHQSSRSCKYVSDYDLSITYRKSDDNEENARREKMFEGVKKYLTK